MSPTASPIRIGVTDAAMIHEVQDSEVLLSGVEPVDIRALDRIADFVLEDIVVRGVLLVSSVSRILPQRLPLR